ncbi:MAG: hypothetical protein K6G62_06845 [Eubacterium sp.]|nr:hypothetical protein [Eubacterium sp.]
MKFDLKNIRAVYVLVPLSILAVLWTIMAFTGQWPNEGNGYNSYALQSLSWLHGRLDLGGNYEWLELAIYGGKYYVSFPPFPSFVLLPFAAVCGSNTPDHWIVLVTTIIGAIYATKLTETVTRTKEHTAFWVYFLYLASGLMFVSLNGFVWFIAQSMCFTLSVMSLYYATKGRGGISLTLWACAVGCRPMVAIYLPLLAYILWQKLKREDSQIKLLPTILQKFTWYIGPLVLALTYMILNYKRFGSPIEFGHNYLPEFTRTPTGQFHVSYLMENLKNLFRLPQVGAEGEALTFFTMNGMAFWLITPLFITVAMAWIYYVIKGKNKNYVTLIMIPILVLAHILFICCHRTLGGWHFGNRYLLDALPYLYYGLLLWMPREGWFAKINQPLFFLGFSLNLVGTVATYNYWIS